MPAYNFQQFLTSYIEDGSKGCTVRAERTGRSRHARPGDKLYLYTGQRTKHCRKIGEAVCTAVCRVLITEQGIALDDGVNGALLPEQQERFAWSDGFRPPESTLATPEGAWELMLQWIKKTHALPFRGVVIYWKDFAPADKYSMRAIVQLKIKEVNQKLKGMKRMGIPEGQRRKT